MNFQKLYLRWAISRKMIRCFHLHFFVPGQFSFGFSPPKSTLLLLDCPLAEKLLQWLQWNLRVWCNCHLFCGNIVFKKLQKTKSYFLFPESMIFGFGIFGSIVLHVKKCTAHLYRLSWWAKLWILYCSWHILHTFCWNELLQHLFLTSNNLSSPKETF